MAALELERIVDSARAIGVVLDLNGPEPVLHLVVLVDTFHDAGPEFLALESLERAKQGGAIAGNLLRGLRGAARDDDRRAVVVAELLLDD
jgi:hypothetical protein